MNGAASIQTVLEISGLIIGGIVAIFVAGRWFGWKHREIIEQIASVREVLEAHIDDEASVLERIEEKQKEHKADIKELKAACLNGSGRGK
jgi:hypothetical protein